MNILNAFSKLRAFNGTNWRNVVLDVITRAIPFITYEHHEIHSGCHFFICDFDTDMAVNETLEFVITTPEGSKLSHMTLDFSSGLGATLQIYKGGSNIVGGIPVTPQNNNQNSSTVSILTILKEPISMTDGTRIAGYLAGGNRNGGMNVREKELVLEAGQTYLFRFTSLANSNTLSYCGEWYEHTSEEA